MRSRHRSHALREMERPFLELSAIGRHHGGRRKLLRPATAGCHALAVALSTREGFVWVGGGGEGGEGRKREGREGKRGLSCESTFACCASVGARLLPLCGTGGGMAYLAWHLPERTTTTLSHSLVRSLTSFKDRLKRFFLGHALVALHFVPTSQHSCSIPGF